MSDEFSGLIPVKEHELFLATTARGLEPGTVVFGRFVLKRILGRGGMGIVWLAHDQQLEQDVAIKVLPDVVMHDKEAVADMKRETKRSLQLNHHHIVRIYDFNQDDKGAGISMEFVDGETLSAAKVEQPHGCFNVEQAGPWLEQICEALAYAHSTAKIVHRDLKPANIMLSKNNTIKVTDFGIARSISDSVSRVSMRHASSGTMVYMSPQQSAGARSSSSDDIYALGATIYDLLTGKPPFYSGNIQHQLESITPPNMTSRRHELERQGTPIPEAWEKAVAACLEKEPGKRPASVQDLAQRLNLHVTIRAATVVEKMSAPPPPPPPPPVQVASPRKPILPPGLITPARVKVFAVAAVCLGLLGAIPAAIMWYIGQGTITVQTVPAGALVSVGAETVPSPAMFSKIWSGKKTVVIHLDGYDPVELPALVVKDQVADLGTIQLTRSTGSVTITSVPKLATSTLRLVQSPVQGEGADNGGTLSGQTPGSLPAVPTGKYELTTSAEGFPDAKETIEVKRGDKIQAHEDLVKDNALHLLSQDESAAVLSGQPLPEKIRHDTGLKSYFEQTLHGYLKINEFKLAQDQLKELTGDLGVKEPDAQQQFDQGEKKWLGDAKTKFNQLLQANHFASAKDLLDDLDARAPQPMTADLRTALAQAKDAHDQATDKMLNDIAALDNAGKTPDAYSLALKALAHDSDEPRLVFKAANLELPMLSTYDRVSTRYKSMNALLANDAGLSQDAEFTRLFDIFQKNMNLHDWYRNQMAPYQHEIAKADSQISDLRAEQVHNQKKADGYKLLSVLGFAGGIGGAAANSAPGAVAGFAASAVGANGAAAREGDVQSLQEQINAVRSRTQESEDQLAPLQKEYDALKQTPIQAVK